MSKVIKQVKAVAIAAVLSVFTLQAQASEALDGVAPGFALPSNQNSTLNLADLKGEVVMINFWATWCGPCRKEMPLLDAMYDKYKDLGFTILGVNVDTDKKAPIKMLKKSPVSFPVLFDEGNTVSKLYGVDAMPTTVLVDREGNMRYLHRGYKPGYEKLYEKELKQMFRE